MARKKSAAKKAREQASKEAVDVSDSTKLVKEDEKVIAKKERKPEADEESVSSENEESSEEEDEFGALITQDVDEGIQKVLAAIKNDPKKLLDPNVKFFNEDDIAKSSNESKEKPMYLKDYHRMNLLSGSYKDDEDMEDNEYGTVDGEKPFAVAQREERMQILSDIKNAFSGDDEEGSDDDFLKKKEKVPSNEEEDTTVLPNPSNETEFLTAFVNKQAWIPKKNDKTIDLDRIDQDDEEDFDNAVENFEHAYNFRYEDPNAAEIVSYARNQATLRRSATNSRKRQREKKLELKEEEEKEKEELLKKKKALKMNKVMDRLVKIKEAVGGDVKDEVIEKVFGDSLLNDDFDDADWDSKMSEIFNEQYYGEEIEKPEWDEDDDIMADFHEEKKSKENKEEEEGEEEEEVEEQPEKKSNKKQKLKEKKSSKKDKESLKEKAKHIVEANSSKILDDIEEERGRSKNKEEVKFKYREVSPESFGLTNRDIFLADDKDLNNFIGIKKFAPYRAKELRMKDKRKYAKKRNLEQWRKETFRGKKFGPDNAETDEVWLPMEDNEMPKKKKSKH